MFTTTLIISIINIFKWNNDNKTTEEQVKKIEEITEITDTNDNEQTIIIKPVEDIPKTNPYWDYIKMNLINVDFKELKSINNQVKGWIKVNGTNINYPFVQAENNDYYINHTFNKSYNDAGWIFMDYRNNESDKNKIIYGHSRLDKTMFGTLRKVVTSDWLKDQSNFIVRLSTEKENTLWQVFSTYLIPVTNDYLKTNFSSDEEYQTFIDMITKRSTHNFNTTATVNDQILTLSTCYKTVNRIVLHAKLIKTEPR